jgi:predicted metal-dependent hydrolase
MDAIPLKINGRRIDVELQRKRMKTVRLKVHADGRVVLSVPHSVPDKWLREYLAGKTPWIEKQLAIVRADAPRPLQNGTVLRILGKPHTVKIVPASRPRILLEGETLSIAAPRPDDTAAVKRQLDRWWRAQALGYFTSAVERWHPVVASHGVPMPRVTVRRMKTLWGSCHIQKGAVTFNTHLYAAPPPCVNYIVLHELAHFLHRRHDKAFYAFIAAHMPDWRQRRRALHAVGIPLG